MENSDIPVIGGLTDEDASAECSADFVEKPPSSPAITVKFPNNLKHDKTRKNHLIVEAQSMKESDKKIKQTKKMKQAKVVKAEPQAQDHKIHATSDSSNQPCPSLPSWIRFDWVKKFFLTLTHLLYALTSLFSSLLVILLLSWRMYIRSWQWYIHKLIMKLV
ncbi:hypothetical protein BJV74DRAFT_800159 [Russula compacta]|nr:hypothetical protein BJV74DRAFT_800159 [Russula compacta]